VGKFFGCAIWFLCDERPQPRQLVRSYPRGIASAARRGVHASSPSKPIDDAIHSGTPDLEVFGNRVVRFALLQISGDDSLAEII
jgi:hypothetical protein